MDELSNIAPPHLNAQVYRNDTSFPSTTKYLDYIETHVDGTVLIGCSELTGRIWNGGVKVVKSIEEAEKPENDGKINIALSTGTAAGCFVEASNKILVCEDNGSVSIWSYKDNVWGQWEEDSCVTEHDSSVLAVDCIDPGKVYVTAGADGNVKVWDIADMICQNSYAAHSAPVAAVAVRPGGSGQFLTCSADRHVTLWDKNTMDKVEDVAVLDSGARCAAWLGESRVLVGDDEGVLRLLDLRRGAGGGAGGGGVELARLPAPVHRVVVQEGSSHVAVCCDNSTVYVYNVAGAAAPSARLYRGSAHAGYVRGLAFARADRGKLHSVGWDGATKTHTFLS